MDKTTLRKKFKSVRLCLSEKEKKILDEKLQRNFLESEEYRNCENILVYVSGKIEVDTHLIIENALREKNVFCPKCYEKGIGMDFFRIDGFSQLNSGKYGIYEPSETLPVWNCMESKKNLCVVPGLSFDKNGYRLGFGKGYYDRFLSDFEGIKAGLCYENCVSKKLPIDENDISADLLVTEKNIYYFS